MPRAPTPLLHICSVYEKGEDFMSSVSGSNHADIAEAFISASKYLDEIIYISNKLVIRSVSLVFSHIKLILFLGPFGQSCIKLCNKRD